MITPAPLEPFRIKATEPIPLPTELERRTALDRAGHNVFKLAADSVIIDLLTDSGTGSMSAAQWSAIMRGDETYAGSRSFDRFQDAVIALTGYSEVIPTHQGRAAERIIYSNILRPGDISVSNNHFDTTQANVELAGGQAVNLPSLSAQDDTAEPFGGNIDIEALEKILASESGIRVRCVVLTLPDNAGGGKPVSIDNVRDTRKVCDAYEVPLWLDASRFAENAYMISARDATQSHLSPRDIAGKLFELADGCFASLKKDGLGNTGGLIALRDPTLARRFRDTLIATEGYETYGGLAGRDLEALAVGLQEVTDPHYLRYRADTAAWFASALHDAGMPVLQPAGCHAVYIDAGKLLPHIPAHELPGQSLACQLYLEAGVRCCELGTLAFGRRAPGGGPDIPAPRELVRLALPRRVYTRSHLEWVTEAAANVAERAKTLTGYRIVEQPDVLRHFTARLTPLSMK